MKQITYNGETHTFSEWCRILQEAAETEYDPELKKFAEELVITDSVTNAELYELYSGGLSKVSFEKILRKFRPDLVPYRTSKVRGWKLV